MAYDLIIQGGTVVDGSGLPGVKADVGISGDRIAAIGDLKGQAAKETIDAEGHIVSPGFVDGHTHMDAQVFWDPLGTCSCWHGVTSVVMGNCGFTLAPCAEKDKGLVFSNLEKAEDISPAAMEAGIPWSWETFGEYLGTLDKLPKGINYGGYVGHSAIRAYIMGERAMTEHASADDLAAMKRVLVDSMRAGAMGFSTSRGRGHRTAEGLPVASRIADWSEIEAMVDTLSELGAGIFEITRNNLGRSPEDTAGEREILKALAIRTGVPITFGSSWYHRTDPGEWIPQVQMVDETNAAGGKMMIQATATWNSSLRSFETLMLFDRAPVWFEFRKLPLTEQAAGLRDPEMRRRLVEAAQAHVVSEDPTLPNALRRAIDWEKIYPLYNIFPPFRSVAEIASERNQDPIETYIDLALEHDLKLFFANPNSNDDPDFVLSMIRHPHAVVTFSDSGAHVNSVINSSLHSYLLGYWVRERQAIPMEYAIRKITFDIASFWGLKGRGLLREGWQADVTIFNPETVLPLLPTLVHDLPTGAERLLQKAQGFKATIVNGQVLLRDGEHTGALPGRVMRGALAQTG